MCNLLTIYIEYFVIYIVIKKRFILFFEETDTFV